MRKSAIITILLGGIVQFTGVAAATVRSVPSPYATIQAAIDDCNNDDVVIVEPNVYTGAGNRDIDFLGKAIMVRSINPNDPCVVANTIIDCNSEFLEGYRGFYFHNGEGASSILDGFTITNGLAWNENGGGILCQNSSPTIRNCVITGNSAELHMIAGGSGGGIYCEESSPDIINCTIKNNTCSFNGGGIGVFYGAPTVSDCTVNNNVANIGGGIACQDDNAVITNCVITNNEAKLWGAGIGCEQDSNALIYNCSIKENFGIQENTRGGGISCSGSSPTISQCLIAGCTADYGGGGIYCADGSNPAISSCTIVDNNVGGGSTGVYGRGGGIYCYSSDPNMINSILWANTADSAGPQIALRATGYPSTLAISYSDVEGGQAEAYVESGCTLNWGTGNTDADPCFVTGPDGNHYLSQIAAGQAFDSPCVDTGSNTAENLGLDEFTTRTDGVIDEDTADMGYHYPAAMCVVPNVVNMTQADASAAIIAAGFTVGNITTAYSDTIVYRKIISSNPAAGATPGCGTAVDYVVSEGSDCYVGMTDFNQWTQVGRPICWCYPRQCLGDADGKPQGKSPNVYWVASNDLIILKSAWLATTEQLSEATLNGLIGACADFTHKDAGKAPNLYRVSVNDLTILKTHWCIPNGPAGTCSPGNRIP